ncbi:MAG: pyridoxal-phosphate dependent enzyme [Alphaproteobacteria bacterium]|nr:pyridoxal-phosphate dependent enzyme [Alphaproteobacteria bacterium]
MTAYSSALDMIGNTPLLQVTKIDTGPCQLFLKLENQNPGGSIKDRIALSMIEEAEKKGLLKPKGTIIEATAGNTGLGLALVAAQKGYKLILVIPDKMSQEKIFHLKALGAEIVLTRSDVTKGHPDYYQDLAYKLSKEIPGSYYINQFENEANIFAHEKGTGPEIWQQMNHHVDAIICGVGSGGTLTGLGRFFQKTSPNTKFILADPKGSILADVIKTGHKPEPGSWLVEGVGEDFIPAITDLSYANDAYTIDDKESFETAHSLLKHEGILAGSSSGTLIAAALRYCRAQTKPQKVLTFVCDSGNKYLSKMYNDHWLFDRGLLNKNKFNDLRDLIIRCKSERSVITASPQDTLLSAYNKMKLYDISQLPVINDKQAIGLINQNILFSAIAKNQTAFDHKVESIMVKEFVEIDIKSPLDVLKQLLLDNEIVIVNDNHAFYGLITRIDFLSYLLRQPKI